ncbi:MAG: zinc-ribbon domain-containing protein, partial [Cetobacterium sp.]
IVTKSMDWKVYTREEKESVMQALKMAQGIKLIVDTPILNEDGSISIQAKKMIATPAEESIEEKKTETKIKARFCSECGFQLKEEAKFCSECGTRA